MVVVKSALFCYTLISIHMPNKPGNNLVRRPPVVVVMGHIDHGKSSFLDYVRKANVVAGEVGGITQHVGAYQAEHVSADGTKHPITFLDTPGHEAFCSIRERGAEAADIAILIVSAEDGVKPQTVEAYENIKASKIPFVVAITKIDKPNANLEKAKTSLGEHEIYVEGWGGDVPCVAISNVTGEGIPELLDMVVLVAELADLKSDPAESATGVVIESELDTRKGISATLLIKNGMLKTGTFVVAGSSYSPVRYIEDFKGEKVDSASASMPVVVVGWSKIPGCGSTFATVVSKKDAERMAGAFEAERRRATPVAPSVPLPTKAADKLKPDEKEEVGVILPIVIKADVIGSLEGVKFELAKIKHDKVELKIVSEGIGDINENDIKLAQGDPSIMVVGFNAPPDKKTATMIERAPVPLQIRNFAIIYELSAYVNEALAAKIPKEYVEEMTGRAKILAIFSKEKDRQVVGGKVETGMIESGNDVRIMRRDAEIGRGKIRELQEKKVKTREVAEGHEFGVMIEAKVEIAAGDRIEAVRIIEKSS
jgi:translation initiation factor IF-2